eukprot:jgi/Chrzof1/11594/Cz06g01140.t1
MAREPDTHRGGRAFSEHEQAIENMYFSKEDERLLHKILSKAKYISGANDTSAAKQSAAAEEGALRQIVGKYNVSKEDLKALIDWKHAHY